MSSFFKAFIAAAVGGICLAGVSKHGRERWVTRASGGSDRYGGGA